MTRQLVLDVCGPFKLATTRSAIEALTSQIRAFEWIAKLGVVH